MHFGIEVCFRCMHLVVICMPYDVGYAMDMGVVEFEIRDQIEARSIHIMFVN